MNIVDIREKKNSTLGESLFHKTMAIGIGEFF